MTTSTQSVGVRSISHQWFNNVDENLSWHVRVVRDVYQDVEVSRVDNSLDLDWVALEGFEECQLHREESFVEAEVEFHNEFCSLIHIDIPFVMRKDWID